MPFVSLTCHPSGRCQHVRQLAVHVDLRNADILALRYILEADVERLRLPAVKVPARTDGLWRHTCFEVFLRSPRSNAYCELNFSPSHDWAAYRFDSYRAGMKPLELSQPPTIETHSKMDRYEISVRASTLSPAVIPGSGVLQIALSAVIEDDAGTLSYWALKHPDGKADFHHSEGFALTLPTDR